MLGEGVSSFKGYLVTSDLFHVEISSVATKPLILQGKGLALLLCTFLLAIMIDLEDVSPNPYMNCSLNSLKVGYIGDYVGEYYRAY